MPLRQKMEVPLGPFQVPPAELSAAAHRNLRLHDLIAMPHGVGLRIEKRLDTLFLIGKKQMFPGEKGTTHSASAKDHVDRQPQFNENGHRGEDETEHQRRTEVGLQQDQQEGNGRQQDWHHQLPDGVTVGDVFAGVITGQGDHQHQFGQFGRLQIEKTQRYPALCSAGTLSDKEDGQQQQDDDNVEKIVPEMELLVIETEQEDDRRKPHQKKVQLLQVGRRPPRLRRIGGAVEIEQSHAADQQEHDQQAPVKMNQKSSVETKHSFFLTTGCRCRAANRPSTIPSRSVSHIVFHLLQPMLEVFLQHYPRHRPGP